MRETQYLNPVMHPLSGDISSRRQKPAIELCQWNLQLGFMAAGGVKLMPTSQGVTSSVPSQQDFRAGHPERVMQTFFGIPTVTHLFIPSGLLLNP